MPLTVNENSTSPPTATSKCFNTSGPETTRTAASRRIPQKLVSGELGRARGATLDFVPPRIHERFQCAGSVLFPLASIIATTPFKALCCGLECLGEQQTLCIVPVDWIPLRTVASNCSSVSVQVLFGRMPRLRRTRC